MGEVDLDLTNVVDDSEQFAETDHDDIGTMDFEAETNSLLDSEVMHAEGIPEILTDNNKQHQPTPKTEVVKSTRLPLARIKNIMKMDPDVNIVHQDAVFLVAKATEMFLETMAKETYAYLPKNKKTINKKELDIVINKVDCLCFLEGAMDF